MKIQLGHAGIVQSGHRHHLIECNLFS